MRGRWVNLSVPKRFIDGQYAWAVRESFMLAYVRDQSTTASCLLPFLEKDLRKFQINEPANAVVHPSLDIVRTAHARGFRYLNRARPGDNPGAIAISHLWLQLERPKAGGLHDSAAGQDGGD